MTMNFLNSLAGRVIIPSVIQCCSVKLMGSEAQIESQRLHDLLFVRYTFDPVLVMIPMRSSSPTA